jgi:hypothetical protein
MQLCLPINFELPATPKVFTHSKNLLRSAFLNAVPGAISLPKFGAFLFSDIHSVGKGHHPKMKKISPEGLQTGRPFRPPQIVPALDC